MPHSPKGAHVGIVSIEGQDRLPSQVLSAGLIPLGQRLQQGASGDPVAHRFKSNGITWTVAVGINNPRITCGKIRRASMRTGGVSERVFVRPLVVAPVQ